MKPIIGIPLRSDMDEEKRNYLYIFDKVKNSIIKMNAIPFPLMPPQNVEYFNTRFDEMPELTEEEKEIINNYLDYIDGLFIPGGYKISKIDLYILDEAIKKDMPILGVCLGMQLMSMYNDSFNLEDIKTNINHKGNQDDKYIHSVKISKDSLLYKIIGKEEFEVNSFHKKQAFKNKIYKNIGYAPDGTLEAMENSNNTFNIGVQWHPEKMIDYDENAKKLMKAFIDASINYKKNKKYDKIK